MSDRVQETQVLSGTPAQILEIIADVESYPQWQPQMAEVEVMERDDAGRPSTVRFKFKGQMFTANYTLAYEYHDDGLSFRALEGDILKTLDGRYTFADAGDGNTSVTYALEAVPAIKIPAMLRRQGAKRMVEDLFTGLRNKLDA